MNVTAKELAQRFGLKRAAGGYSGACPACGYKNGLRVCDKPERTVWWCASCQDQAAVTAALLGHVPAAPIINPSPGGAADNESRTRAALVVLDRTLPAEASPVATYLNGRGLQLPEAAPLRFLPMAKHPSGTRLPAMVAVVVDLAGKPCAIHRTFLAPGGAGKAAVDPVRMTLGPVRGGAVRLYPAAPRLVVAEGIETALAAAILLRMPAWAAVSAGNLADALELPEAVREVVVAGDNDAPGLKAARQAVARFRAQGRKVQLAVPDKAGADFNDILRARGAHD